MSTFRHFEENYYYYQRNSSLMWNENLLVFPCDVSGIIVIIEVFCLFGSQCFLGISISIFVKKVIVVHIYIWFSVSILWRSGSISQNQNHFEIFIWSVISVDDCRFQVGDVNFPDYFSIQSKSSFYFSSFWVRLI